MNLSNNDKLNGMDLFVKKIKKDKVVLLLLLLATVIFAVGWFFDDSRPQAGQGWADQMLYTASSQRMQQGDLPTAAQLHYTIGYPLLGLLGFMFQSPDRFVVTSYLLYIGSIAFCYYAAKRVLDVPWAAGFVLLLMAWDGVGRTTHYMTDVFITPWNNQVLFFAFAFFFWLLVSKVDKKPSNVLVSLAGGVAGLTFLCREESVLFIAPLLAVFLYLSKAQWRQWLMAFGIMGLCFLPQLAVKQHVIGDVAESGHDNGYSETLGKYLVPEQFYRNTLETIVDSHFFNEPQATRKALFQEAPWLWLGPIGIVLIVTQRKYPKGLKWFALISCGLVIFYLSGSNMSAQKLQFHCLRYISAGLIIMNLGVIVVVKELAGLANSKLMKNHE